MNDVYEAFRLNFEQQKKRAKDLLKAARGGDPAALSRFSQSSPKLADAQYLIARELRCENWAALKRHIAVMGAQRADIGRTVLDDELRTLHIRCGSDLKTPLQQAGLRGDFYEHSYPYLIGPVREGSDCLERRAQFIVDSYIEDGGAPREYLPTLAGLQRDEARLREAADYERVVIWSEGDTYDQLVLIRLLGHFASQRCPPRLELINSGDFPGAMRFIGLGQLPPEALRVLWSRRTQASSSQLQLGLVAWKALARSDPRPLATLMRSGTKALPLLAPALERHLRELPSINNGLSLTEEMALRLLAQSPLNLIRMIGRMTYETDPLPGQGDMNVRNRVLALERAREPLFTRRPGVDRQGRARTPWTDVLEISELGRAVLRGEVDLRDLHPPSRWVGGVHIGPANPDWRWDGRTHKAVLRQGPSTE